MIFKPLNGHVVVMRTSSEAQSKGGIIIPEVAQKESQIGLVMAVFEPYTDEDGKYHAPQFKVGEYVLFPKYDGEEFVMGAWGKVLLMRHTSVRGVIVDYRPEPEFSRKLEQILDAIEAASYAESAA